jgi:hypothetical protein
MRTSIRLIVCLLLGCAPAAPEEPTWLADVRPILAANCIRCHGAEPRHDAPASFRLDVLDDVGEVKGARSMAEFVAARVSMGDMPAEGPGLSTRQREILDAWKFTTAAGLREDNRPPAATLGTGEGGEGRAMLDVLVTDEDGDLVHGELKADGATVGRLRAGAQRIELDTTGLPAGSRALTAILDDGSGAISVPLGALEVAHENAVPGVEVLAPKLDALFVAGTPATITYRVTDPDAGDPLTVDVQAVLDDLVVPVAAGHAPAPSGLGELALDTSALPAGSAWRVEVTVTDGKATRTASSRPFIVSRPERVETYEAVRPLVNEFCRRCHSAHLPTGPNFDLLPKLQEYSGRAWRKVAAGQMPPPSMEVVFPDLVFTDEARARLTDFFYAGAPP